MQLTTTLAIFIVLWTAAVALVAVTGNWAWLLLPWAVFLVEELVFYYLGKELLFSNASRVETLYDLIGISQTYIGNTDDNLTEGYYKDEQPIEPRQAERQKFAHILELLQAKPGDVILNMGCGACNFESFCRERGIRMIGVSISTEQQRICESKNVEMIVGDFTKFIPSLVGVADHIITIGTFEHIVGDVGGTGLPAYKSKANKVSDVLRMYRKYFKQNGQKHRIICSVLHQNVANVDDLALWTVQRGACCIYFLDKEGFDAASAAERAGYSVTYWKDYSWHYFQATVRDPKHFGNPAKVFGVPSLLLVLSGLLNPYMLYLWWLEISGCWMYQFDGSYHLAADPKYSLASPGRRPCPLYYGVFEV